MLTEDSASCNASMQDLGKGTASGEEGRCAVLLQSEGGISIKTPRQHTEATDFANSQDAEGDLDATHKHRHMPS